MDLADLLARDHVVACAARRPRDPAVVRALREARDAAGLHARLTGAPLSAAPVPLGPAAAVSLRPGARPANRCRGVGPRPRARP
ncbi:hypothetical protein OPKNFCMD_6013 [Methylobacterium crusticola]|uniref:Uncharacterized protein n=1 Tax=Methylobacterium crusticola TaxID=1697972 RepID=A0ABQ4R8Y5_9HYPH|nr:hypothetical protein OPKNFCMD_6013 [Methylobacterium crusticola]